MTTPIVMSGTKFSISAELPTTNDVAGFVALNWTQIRGVRVVNDLITRHRVVENAAIGERPRMVRVGMEPSSLLIETYRLADDGQSMLRGAVDSNNDFSFRLIAPDGLTQYFTASITAIERGVGAASGNLCDTKFTLDIQGEIVEA